MKQDQQCTDLLIHEKPLMAYRTQKDTTHLPHLESSCTPKAQVNPLSKKLRNTQETGIKTSALCDYNQFMIGQPLQHKINNQTPK